MQKSKRRKNAAKKPRQAEARQVWRRTPTSAARHASAIWGEILDTPANAIWASPKGTRRVQLQRHLVAHCLREELGYRQTEIAGALGKDRATIRHSLLAIWRMREDDRVDQLIARFRAVWIDPASEHAAEFAVRRAAFDATFARLASGVVRLQEEDLGACLAAAADAAPIGVSGVELRAPETPAKPTTAVPVIDLHPAAAILGHAPAIKKLIGAPSFDHAPTRAGGVRLSFSSPTLRDRMVSALDAAKDILERAGFSALSDGVYQDGAPRAKGDPVVWRGVLRVAPARMVGIAAALGLLFGGAMAAQDVSVGVELEAV